VLAETVFHLSYPLAFAAGVVSFLSPCVFPLAPGYVAFLSGQASERMHLLLNGAGFVLGFSAVFVAFFYVLRALNVTLLVEHQSAVNVVAGLIVVLLALQTLGVLRWRFLMRDQRVHELPRGRGFFSAVLLGVTFAAGWTPCIGPQLTAILAVANQGDFTGLPVMLAYCLGLAVPFLLIALLTDRLQGVIRGINKRMGVVNVVAGALLLVFGLLLITNQFTFFNRFSPQSPFDL
jgi:cytochrome c-type biogenesis protein